MEHIPVLLNEVIAALAPKPNGVYIDATLGDGGHTQAILEHSKPNGRLLGIDQDKQQLAVAKDRLANYANRATLVCSRFSDLQTVANQEGFGEVDGVLFDLGISSRQLNNPSYGLTFEDSSSLDMRLSDTLSTSAADLLNRASEVELADMLYHYGDRHNSRVLARKLMQYRRKGSFATAADVKQALQLNHPSQLAPIFQAMRIMVNQEFDELTRALPQAVSLLKPGGTLAIISFHSGEDRLVKQFMRQSGELEPAKKLGRPTYDEIKRNPRARSALLRIATKL